MRVKCPDCRTSLSRDDINIEKMVGICPHCAKVIAIEEVVDEESEFSFSRREPDLEMPKGLSIRHRGGDLELRIRWFSMAAYILAAFCFFWDAFMAVWFYIAYTEKIWMMGAFGILHGLVGVALTYFCVCTFVNHTIVTVNSSFLTIEFSPLPWLGRKKIESGEIEQLFCKDRIRHTEQGNHVSYELWMIRKGKKSCLLGGYFSAEQVRFLEQEIERFLGIKNRPVSGEFTG